MILFLIGIILIENLDGKAYRHTSINNCSQTFFDEATLNYLASFKFLSENIDDSCPSAKAIAFRKSDLLEVEMRVQIVESIWKILSNKEKFSLMYQLRNRLHYSCNSIALHKELCRTKYALDGGVFISTYDGSLLKHPFQKSCSICLLRTINNGFDLPHNQDYPSVVSLVNLSLVDSLDLKELQSDDIFSVKFIRSQNKFKENSHYSLQHLLGKSFPYQSTLISDSVTYNVQVKLKSGGAHIILNKGQIRSRECQFRCDWSSTCLYDMTSICDNKTDCRYGDDENPLICQHYNRTIQSNRMNSSVRKLFNYNAVKNITHKNENYLKFLLPVIFSTLVVVIIGIGIFIIYRRYKRKISMNKKMSNVSNVAFSKIHQNSTYIQKSTSDELTATTSLNQKLRESQHERSIHSGWCTATIHHKSKNNRNKQFIHPKSFRKQEKSDKYYNEQFSDLCKQINYPDLRTRSNWLRAYFQLSRSNNMKLNKPLVLNICNLPPVSFSCKQ